MKVLVTGGAGFIGSAVVTMPITETAAEVTNFDELTHAGNVESLAAAKPVQNTSPARGTDGRNRDLGR